MDPSITSTPRIGSVPSRNNPPSSPANAASTSRKRSKRNLLVIWSILSGTRASKSVHQAESAPALVVVKVFAAQPECPFCQWARIHIVSRRVLLVGVVIRT
jgi:hypothetical protein